MRRNRLRKILIAIVSAAMVLYGCMCAFLYAAQGILLYHPAPLLFEPDAQAISIAGKTGPLRGWVVDPGQRDALIYFGGKGESVERDVAFFRELLPGRSVYLVPYRGYGPNAGKPSEAGIEADALAVFDLAQASHANVAVMGRSLGSGVATYVAARRPTDRLVLVTPYDSILNLARSRYRAFPVSLLLEDRYESWRNADAITAPTLAILAAGDQAVPPESSGALLAHFHSPKTVVVIPGADHNNLSNSPLYSTSIREFLAHSPASTRPVPPR